MKLGRAGAEDCMRIGSMGFRGLRRGFREENAAALHKCGGPESTEELPIQRALTVTLSFSDE